MKKYLSERYSGYGNILLDVAVVGTLSLFVLKILGFNISFFIVVSPIAILLVLTVVWFFVFTYCMTYQYGGSLIVDVKNFVKSKVKGVLK